MNQPNVSGYRCVGEKTVVRTYTHYNGGEGVVVYARVRGVRW